MRIFRCVKTLLVVFSIAMLSACGSGDGDTNGTLNMDVITVTDLGGGNYTVQTNATYIPTGGKDPQGTEIDFDATFATSTQTTTRSASIKLGTTGVASVSWPVLQTTEPILVTIRASVGGLSDFDTKSVPAISPLSAAPAAVAFTNAEGIGVAKSITITGGYSPYTVSSDTTADIGAQISGSVVTLTKFVNVSATPVSAAANVFITDNKGNQLTVPVGYFK